MKIEFLDDCCLKGITLDLQMERNYINHCKKIKLRLALTKSPKVSLLKPNMDWRESAFNCTVMVFSHNRLFPFFCVDFCLIFQIDEFY